MHTIALIILTMLPTPAPKPACEELGPRWDNTYVTVCAGTVVSVRDQLGNVRTMEVR